MLGRWLLAVTAIVFLSSAMAACGGSDNSADELKRENEVRQARQQGAQAEKLRQLERQLREQRRHGSGSSTTGTGTTGPGGEYKGCDANISVKSETTTCPFAQNVFYEYWTSGRASSIDVYSPSTRQSYATRCDDIGGEVLCATAQGAGVRLSKPALDAYSQRQAEHFAATHDLGP
jgi:hypothetical protein